MEDKITIKRARLGFQDYMKIVVIIGLCAGVLSAGISIVADLYELIFAEEGHGFTDFLLKVLMNLASAILAPAVTGLFGVLQFPVYHYITNRWFSMSLSVYGELDH